MVRVTIYVKYCSYGLKRVTPKLHCCSGVFPCFLPGMKDAALLDSTMAISEFPIPVTTSAVDSQDDEQLRSSRLVLGGFRMPAEWEPHSGCWMLWPVRVPCL